MAWGPIQPATAGFLSLLGLKNLGKNPLALHELVQPTLDMLPWYLNGQSEHTQFEGPVQQDVFVQRLVQVPENEWWYVHNFLGVLSQPAAGGFDAKFGLYVRGEVNGDTVVVSGPWGGMIEFIDGQGKAFSQLSGVWVQPGTWLEAVHSAEFGQSTIHLMMRYTRVRN